mmetsp:Transcript_57108/g.94659  ORF Transcript_57108/g.94659 Transcript_57108/m.94659 type:complete len:160 (+) Transcript_57108:345-824(+)
MQSSVRYCGYAMLDINSKQFHKRKLRTRTQTGDFQLDQLNNHTNTTMPPQNIPICSCDLVENRRRSLQPRTPSNTAANHEVSQPKHGTQTNHEADQIGDAPCLAQRKEHLHCTCLLYACVPPSTTRTKATWSAVNLGWAAWAPRPTAVSLWKTKMVCCP